MNTKQQEYFHVILAGIPFDFLNDNELRIVKGRKYIAITSFNNTKNYPNIYFTELTDDERIEWDLLGNDDKLETPNF
jgi:hypothetical protein